MIEKRRSLRNDAAYMLAILYTCGFLGMCFLLVLREVSEASRPMMQQLISIMSMIQAAVAGYFFGSSKTAAETSQATARIAEKSSAVAASAVAASSGSAQTQPIVTENLAVASEHTTITPKDSP